jgi:23S rRNA (cytidine1920-2'-O)/16S rRNA (cytidine1409-2'-O)-methyltransferase
MRLDALLVQRGLLPSREKAKEAIARGEVLVAGRLASKAAQPVQEDTALEVTARPAYVSRGGLKLEKALRCFPGFSVEEDRVLDIGASTGGFTDCLLKHGAARVYAIDVGTGQLAEALRHDPRVISMEGVNARALTPADIGELADGAVMDVSFISITKIIPALERLVVPGGYLMALVKPQFESGRAAVGKRGVVKRPETHRAVLRQIAAFVRNETDFALMGLDVSPIQGPEGNVEFLMLCRRGAAGLDPDAAEERIEWLVHVVHGHA